MAKPSPPSKPSIILFFLHLLLLTTTTAPSTAPFQELETVRQVLTKHGYILFTNAIATSDLQYQLVTPTPTNTSACAATEEAPTSLFTLFAPTDELLFALDMSSDANAYIRTLKYHVIPNRRHTFSDLRKLTSPFLETLLPHTSVLIGKTRDGDVLLPNNATVVVMVDGIRINRPDLFLGPRFAVHGIDGILLTGLNVNHQFDRNDGGSDLFPQAGSQAETTVCERDITAEGAPPPVSHSEGQNIGGKIPAASRKDKADKKKIGRHPRASRGSHRRMPRGNRRHRRHDL
ncbi:hypothetical protein OROHE_024313 [Orobanche hederae]